MHSLPAYVGVYLCWQTPTPLGGEWKFFKSMASNKRDLARCLLAMVVSSHKERNGYFQRMKQTENKQKKTGEEKKCPEQLQIQECIEQRVGLLLFCENLISKYLFTASEYKIYMKLYAYKYPKYVNTL